MELKNIYEKEIDREIQGVIKVDDDSYLSQELSEYVVTEEILKYIEKFFEAYKKGIDGRTDKMGVWISGFFGSGKSHFLKILSYILENKTIEGKQAVGFFNNKIKDKLLLADMQKAGNVSCDIILFNIDSKASLENNENKDKVLAVFEKVFNEKLGLSITPHVAEFERFLIGQGKYEEFKINFKNECGIEWEKERNGIYFRRDEFVNAYAKTLNKSKDEAENWFDKAEDNYSISIDKFATRLKEYIESKGNDHHVIFLVDEIGQYIGDDTSLMLNLQTLVENLGIICGGKAWVVVTSQQDIDTATDFKVKGNDFSKIIGRFDTRLGLSSANVDEVIKKRILNKKDDSFESLEELYKSKESVIKNLLTFTKASEQKNYSNAKDFAEIYPFIPYQFNLLQSVFTGIRKHGSAGKHLSEGERSLLGAFQETARRYAGREIGTLIPFYAFYDTIEQFLEHHIKIVIENAKKNSELEKEIDIQILKILFMLKYVKGIPATIENLATLFVSNIDDDKLAIKDNIKESLRRLETQTLIQRNNEEYIFLTDEEQEINREIKSITIDPNKITEYLKKKIFDEILTDRKYMYNNMQPFPLSLYLDGIKFSQEADIGIRIVTNYPEKTLIAESMREYKYIYANLNINHRLMTEITNILQIEDYRRQKIGIALSSQIETIIKGKQSEAEKDDTRIKDVIAELLKEADLYIMGDKQKVNSRTPQERMREALSILVSSIYSKISFIEKYNDISDVRRLFNESMTTLIGQEVAMANSKAYRAVEEYCKEQNDRGYSITIRSVLQDFSKPPFGYRDEDILYLLTRLLKEEYISLIYNNESQNVTAEETLNKITNRLYYDKTLIKLRKKVNQELINNLKSIARNVFNVIDIRDDEDGMIADFKEKCINKLYNSLVKFSENYRIENNYKYPGEKLIQENIDLISKISRIKDTNEFFEYVNSNKEQISDLVEKVQAVIEFFTGEQRKKFDQAIKIMKVYDDNKDYTDDNEELKKIANEMINVFKMEEPYNDIYKLPTLRQGMIDNISKIYDEKSKPIIERINALIEYIENTLREKELDLSIGLNYTNACKTRIQKLQTTQELKDIYATDTYINGIKEEFIRRLELIELEKNKDIKTNTEKVVLRKSISTESLLNKSYNIDTVKDIDNYINDLRNKLIKALDENKTLRIK